MLCSNLNSILLEQLERTHCERISQRMELASLRGQRTNERREMAATVGDRDRQLDIDAKILGTDGDVEELMALASSELGADLVLEDASFEALRSSGDPGKRPGDGGVLPREGVKRLPTLSSNVQAHAPLNWRRAWIMG